MENIRFENVAQAYRMLWKAIQHNCPNLQKFCEEAIQAMEAEEEFRWV